MTDLLLDLVTYLTAQEICIGDGKDIFRDYRPESPDNVIILQEYGGSGTFVNDSTTHRSVQLLVRNKSATAAKNVARRAYDKLYSDTRFVQLTDERWSQIYLRQTPFKIETDNKNRSLYGFNMGITAQPDKGGL